MLKPNQSIVLYMNDGDEIGTYKSFVEAYNGLRDVRETDKQEHITGNEYYFEFHEVNGNVTNVWSLKIYRRGNKIFHKFN